MRSRLDGVLGDLATETDELSAIVSGLGPQQWRTPTPAPGWDVAMQIAHLAWTDEVATAAATDREAWDEVVRRGILDPEGFVDAEAERLAALATPDLLERWLRAGATLRAALGAHQGDKLPWFGPPMSPTSMATARFMETWAHGIDIREGLGIDPRPTDRIRHVAYLGVRTRDFAFGVNNLTPPAEPFSVTLVSPSEELWTFGPPDAAQTVTGVAHDFCLLVTQRRHRADLDLRAVGPDAERWLEIAQAFAGPPGQGRRPRGERR